MEDSHIICQDLKVSNRVKVSVFGVFDGHGGNMCSLFLKEKFIHDLRMKLVSSDLDRQENFYEYMDNLITDFFREIDLKFRRDHHDFSWRCGSTGVVVLIVGDRIICANLGDSRAILSRGGGCIELSVD
jgi:protein phosphatase 1L